MTLTDTMRERKAVMEDEADAFIIAPGGAGTFEEFFEVLTLKQLGQHRKPIAIFNLYGYYDNLISTVDYSIETQFAKPACLSLFKVFDNMEELAEYVENDDMGGLTVKDFK